MSYYRLYFMDDLSGHVTRFAEFVAESDGEASAMAETHRCGPAMELWCGRKKVKRWRADFGSLPPIPRMGGRAKRLPHSLHYASRDGAEFIDYHVGARIKPL